MIFALTRLLRSRNLFRRLRKFVDDYQENTVNTAHSWLLLLYLLHTSIADATLFSLQINHTMRVGVESLVNVTVFILATTKPGGDGKSLFETRSQPLLNTWGSYFQQHFFVVGYDRTEVAYLRKNCELIREFQSESSLDSSSNPSNQLPQRAQSRKGSVDRNFLHEYRCNVPAVPVDVYTSSSSSSSWSTESSTSSVPYLSATVLLTGNCSSAYFGLGPTCRLQESLRYYYRHIHGHGQNEWLAFMDDDVYIRPLVLKYLLANLTSSTSPLSPSDNNLVIDSSSSSHRTSDKVALIGASMYRSLQYSNRWNRSEHACATPEVFEFPLAQPAFLNRAALDSLEEGIAHNELTELHRLWGGSHDILLGLLLWIHQIPLLSFHRSYFGARLFKGVHTHTTEKPFDSSVTFIFHKVTNAPMSYKKSDPSATQNSLFAFSHYDVVTYLNESCLYTTKNIHIKGDILNNNSNRPHLQSEGVLNSISDKENQFGHNCKGIDVNHLIDASRRIASQARYQLLPMRRSRINETTFTLRKRSRNHDYLYFSPIDCNLI